MRWEYTTFTVEPGGFWGGKIDANAFTSKLNEHGQQGWELVNVFDTNMAEGATKYVVAVFKRPLGE